MNTSMMWRQVPPVTKNLIIVNVLLWLAEVFVPGFGTTLINNLGLHLFGTSLFNPFQVFTYMFLHDNGMIFHVVFNMFTLWMFGRILETVWGSKRFLLFYLVCGIGAGLVQEGVWLLTYKHEYISAISEINRLSYSDMAAIVEEAAAHGDTSFIAAMNAMKEQMVTIGASGAIFGLLLGFAMVFPNMPLYLFFIPVPIKAKYMVIGYAVIELLLGVSANGSSIAHFAHLGGMLFGLAILLYWRHKGTLHSKGPYGPNF